MAVTRYGLTGAMAAYPGFLPKILGVNPTADVIVHVRPDVGIIHVRPDTGTVET